jgi:hypothetical protein
MGPKLEFKPLCKTTTLFIGFEVAAFEQEELQTPKPFSP